MPENVQEAFEAYERHGWQGTLSGSTEGTNAGRKFKNNRGELPEALDDEGKSVYREFDVHYRVSGKNRDEYRFVRDMENGIVYYTDDHYITIVEIVRGE